MKNKIRILSICLICCFLFTSCSPAGNPSQAESANASASAASPAEASGIIKPYKEYFDNRIGNYLMDFVETDTICYYYNGGRLYYWDKLTGEGDVLCARPECRHDDPQICQAAMVLEAFHTLSFVDGKLFWIGEYDHDNDPDTLLMNAILCCNPDGSGRTAVRDLDRDLMFRVQEWRYCEDCYYGIGVKREIRDDQPVLIREIIKIPLDGKQEIETLLHRETDYTAYQLMKVMGKRVYFMLYRYTTDPVDPSIVELLCWDCGTQQLEAVFPEQITDMNLPRFWLEPDGTVYLVDEVNMTRPVQRLTADGLVEEPGFALGADQNYTRLVVSDGITIATRQVAYDREKGIGEFAILVRDFDGNVLYEGPLPMDFRKGLGEEWLFNALAAKFGDCNALYCVYDFRYNNINMNECVVRYEYTLDGLKETLLWAVKQ
jgi:hypothetical protein